MTEKELEEINILRLLKNYEFKKKKHMMNFEVYSDGSVLFKQGSTILFDFLNLGTFKRFLAKELNLIK